MKRKAFVLLPAILLLVVSVSGCTGISAIDSLFGGFCIPGIGTCGQTVQYANDVLVITSLDSAPQTISTGQQLRLSAWIQNNGGETVPQKNFKAEFSSEGAGRYIAVKLYDVCEGLFDKIEVTCPSDADKIIENGHERGCWLNTILPKQTIPVSWNLVAYGKDKIPLETSCNLKVYVQYPYQTKSITSVTFVDYTEYQRMLNENKYSAITSYITEGYGPIKPYLTVETTQPIPVENNKPSDFQMAFQVKNQGSGFLSAFRITNKEENIIKILNSDSTDRDITIESNVGANQGDYKLGELVKAEIYKLGDLELVGKESPKQTFPIKTPYNNKIEKVATYYVTSSIDYMYEFRKEIKVTIKPPAITG
jgi:hypothetical protein